MVMRWYWTTVSSDIRMVPYWIPKARLSEKSEWEWVRFLLNEWENLTGVTCRSITIQKKRLLQLNLHTLKYRRLRGDMIEVYKITHEMYDRSVALELPRNVSVVLEVINMNCKSAAFITIFENFILLHELLTCGTVYRTMCSRPRCQFS